MGRRGDRRPKEVMDPGCPSDKRNLRNRLWQAGRVTTQIIMVLLHSFLKTWGEFLRRLLALAKRRRMRDYDAVTLSAACNSPVLITEGLAGVRGKYGSKIEIRYNGPDLCV